MSWRVLHKAVASSANMRRSDPAQENLHLSDKERAQRPEGRIAMVRHLLDTLKLDVNAPDSPPGWRLGNFYGRPLHYVAMNSGHDCR